MPKRKGCKPKPPKGRVVSIVRTLDAHLAHYLQAASASGINPALILNEAMSAPRLKV